MLCSKLRLEMYFVDSQVSWNQQSCIHVHSSDCHNENVNYRNLATMKYRALESSSTWCSKDHLSCQQGQHFSTGAVGIIAAAFGTLVDVSSSSWSYSRSWHFSYRGQTRQRESKAFSMKSKNWLSKESCFVSSAIRLHSETLWRKILRQRPSCTGIIIASM